MEITLFGAAKTVTGSCYSIKTKKWNILVDCGMFQGAKELERKNYEDFGFDPKDYHYLLLTHAHLDHCGRIPKLVKEGFKGKIYSTSATKDLTYVVLMDAAKIAFHDTINENRKREQEGLPQREPIFTEGDVKTAMELFEVIDIEEKFQINDHIVVKFYEAGHILGACCIQMKIKEAKKETIVVFSGDIGQAGTPIVKDLEIIGEADYVFIESTYGDRLHPPVEERKNEFLKIIRDTYKRGGKLMIPSFAIERTQELLYNLNEFAEKEIMPKMNVYLDSPMAIDATNIFIKHIEEYNKEVRDLVETGDNPFHFPGLIYTKTIEESKKIQEVTKPCIIIAGSGMCTAGRIKHHIRHNISNPHNTLLFVGYQAEGTLGYWIKNGEKKIRLLGHEVFVNAQIKSIDSFSGHADYKGLLNWLRYFIPKPKKVFICHGEERSCKSFAEKVEKTGIKTYIPSLGEKLKL